LKQACFWLNAGIRDKEQFFVPGSMRMVYPRFQNAFLTSISQLYNIAPSYMCLIPRSDRDAIIVATALVHCMTVFTINTDDFVRTGVELLNPWEFNNSGK